MRVLMLGWEFPPFFAGGIGIVCYELTKALTNIGAEITYIMPFGPRNIKPGFLRKLLIAESIAPKIKIHRVQTTMHAYMSSEEYEAENAELIIGHKNSHTRKLYGKNLMQEVHNFAHRAMFIAEHEDFDVIHCHDWMTIPAAVGIKMRTGKKLIVHVHNTVFDRYLSGDNNVEYDVEQLGLDQADKIIAISHYVKNTLTSRYNVDPNKISVIHNAAQQFERTYQTPPKISAQDKVVLFAGRITAQKGPEYFVHAARKVVDVDPSVKFVMAGSGDMLHRMIELAANLGLADKFLFPGFYQREDVERLFTMADVFVMPSVSEPFGIVPLEAMQMGTPVIVSKQSGVSEVIQHVLKVDFWDTHALAEKILAVLKYEELHQTLKEHGEYEAKGLTWNKVAIAIEEEYRKLMQVAA